MGNEASGLDSSTVSPSHGGSHHDELCKLRWKVTKGEGIIKDLTAENKELERQLLIQTARTRALEEQLYHPVQYKIGLLYLYIKSAKTEADAKASIDELCNLAFGTTGLQEPLAHGYLACYYRVIGKDIDCINEHAYAAASYVRDGVTVNNHHCLYLMGAFYYHGILRTVDIRKAISLYKQAAELGHAMAQYQLGSLYYSGAFGVQQNYEAAFGWFQQSADQGFSKAQYWCGYCLECGLGVEMDLESAETYYQCALAQGVDNGNISRNSPSKGDELSPSGGVDTDPGYGTGPDGASILHQGDDATVQQAHALREIETQAEVEAEAKAKARAWKQAQKQAEAWALAQAQVKQSSPSAATGKRAPVCSSSGGNKGINIAGSSISPDSSGFKKRSPEEKKMSPTTPVPAALRPPRIKTKEVASSAFSNCTTGKFALSPDPTAAAIGRINSYRQPQQQSHRQSPSDSPESVSNSSTGCMRPV